ncbi:MAG: hypothetical protein IPP96_00580 [Chitinophagaceae bacterium]|nr:hypothetical protein [Chitinophagaceae bacterium]
MKKTLLLPLLLIFSFFSFSQVNVQTLVKPGAKLIYAVEANEQKYNFIVTVKALVPALVFDWEMTDPVNTSGTITHTATAMISANTMYNFFSGGQKTLDDNTLSVWLSKNTFTGLTKGTKSVLMKMNTNEPPQKMGNTKEDPEELHILVNGEKETVEEFTAKQLNEAGGPAGDDVYFTFANSAKMPIILRMKNGFYIALKEIKTK